MTVIHFPARKPVRKAPAEALSETGQTVESHLKAHRPRIAGENEAVRRFALLIAEKLLGDRELNHAAPFLVSKIVRMLVSESRQVPGEF